MLYHLKVIEGVKTLRYVFSKRQEDPKISVYVNVQYRQDRTTEYKPFSNHALVLLTANLVPFNPQSKASVVIISMQPAQEKCIT